MNNLIQRLEVVEFINGLNSLVETDKLSTV
jgi:hypothetical protein